MPMSVVWQHKHEKCVKEDLYEADENTEKVDLHYYLVTMRFKIRPEVQFQTKYLTTMADEEIASMLMWQLAQLLGVHYSTLK